MAQIRSSKSDYLYALEGVSYAMIILKNKMNQIDDLMKELNNPNLMEGETAKEYLNKLSSAKETVEGILNKLQKFNDKATEICNNNGCYLANDVMDDYESVLKKFNAKKEEIKNKVITSKN